MSRENNLSNLATLARIFQECIEVTQLIKDEVDMHDTDSLANIDYGALLNTRLNDAQVMFSKLDDAALFTSGWEPEDEMESPFVIINNVGQRFVISGLRAQEAFDDALGVVQAGKPFGRKGMKRLTDTYGVTVSFAVGNKDDFEDDQY